MCSLLCWGISFSLKCDLPFNSIVSCHCPEPWKHYFIATYLYSERQFRCYQAFLLGGLFWECFKMWDPKSILCLSTISKVRLSFERENYVQFNFEHMHMFGWTLVTHWLAYLLNPFWTIIVLLNLGNPQSYIFAGPLQRSSWFFFFFFLSFWGHYMEWLKFGSSNQFSAMFRNKILESFWILEGHTAPDII